MRKESDDPRAWFAKAEQDWRVAELASVAGEPLPEQCCYHAQPRAEKYLKGYLKSKNKAFRRSHDLEYLIDLCTACDPQFAAFAEEAEILTRLAEPSRYPMPSEMRIGEREARRSHGRRRPDPIVCPVEDGTLTIPDQPTSRSIHTRCCLGHPGGVTAWPCGPTKATAAWRCSMTRTG